jgi:hypothetical protein
MAESLYIHFAMLIKYFLKGNYCVHYLAPNQCENNQIPHQRQGLLLSGTVADKILN